MVKVNWTDLSLQDIDNIAIFIAKDSPNCSTLFVSKIFEKAKPLKIKITFKFFHFSITNN
jgi:plasmid stabilization system protein ParE